MSDCTKRDGGIPRGSRFNYLVNKDPEIQVYKKRHIGHSRISQQRLRNHNKVVVQLIRNQDKLLKKAYKVGIM